MTEPVPEESLGWFWDTRMPNSCKGGRWINVQRKWGFESGDLVEVRIRRIDSPKYICMTKRLYKSGNGVGFILNQSLNLSENAWYVVGVKLIDEDAGIGAEEGAEEAPERARGVLVDGDRGRVLQTRRPRYGRLLPRTLHRGRGQDLGGTAVGHPEGPSRRDNRRRRGPRDREVRGGRVRCAGRYRQRGGRCSGRALRRNGRS